jgi:hypothetical protein
MTGSFVIKKNRILEILFFIIIFLVNLKMTLNISDFATANLSILIIGISFISLLFTKIDDNIYWIVLFFILSLFRVEASKMLFVSLLVSISRNLYIDKMAKYSFCLTVLFLIINYGLLILGVLHEEYSDFFHCLIQIPSRAPSKSLFQFRAIKLQEICLVRTTIILVHPPHAFAPLVHK